MVLCPLACTRVGRHAWTSSSTARRVSNWRVAVGVESLSNHRYVLMRVQERIVGSLRRTDGNKYFPRWSIGRVNMDLLSAPANIKAWSSHLHGDVAAESLADGLNAALTEISGVYILRLRATGRPSVYWWNEKIADFRVRCVRIRRKLRQHRRYHDSEMVRGL